MPILTLLALFLGLFRDVLDNLEPFWPILAYFKRFWPIVGLFWPILKVCGPCCTYIGPFLVVRSLFGPIYSLFRWFWPIWSLSRAYRGELSHIRHDAWGPGPIWSLFRRFKAHLEPIQGVWGPFGAYLGRLFWAQFRGPFWVRFWGVGAYPRRSRRLESHIGHDPWARGPICSLSWGGPGPILNSILAYPWE